jgi:hypothetical protein
MELRGADDLRVRKGRSLPQMIVGKRLVEVGFECSDGDWPRIRWKPHLQIVLCVRCPEQRVLNSQTFFGESTAGRCL